MRKRNRAILLLVILLLLGGVGYKVGESIWLNKAREIKKNPIKALDYLPEAALQLKDFHRSKIENGRKVWELYGDEARYLKEQKEAVITKPQFYFYDKNGETIEATGNQGRLFFTDQELEKAQFEGAIEVKFRGFVLKSEQAIYFPEKEQILLPGRINLKGDGLELDGVRMEIALQDQKMRLLQNVRTKLQPERLGKKKDKSDGSKESRG